MPTDRWLTLERLYHAALERPAQERAAFLAEACEDETLRRQVLALLEQPSMPEFLGGPAIAVAAAMVDDVHVSQWIGRRIGVYHLQALLGKGGMGEVYRARDTRLGRDVAVKVLPRAFTADPDRLARFEREARVLASLNHPHIGTIHGLEESEGVRALVLELVEGETLADRLHRGAVAIPDALAMARQIADALEAAHDKGIVHRDLKPSNIKITPDGVVKVLDFGLAKGGTEASGYDLTQSPTISIGNTHDGVILGTAPYMSPEQARGQAVDKRTDIWAFGCVLFEMLTGRVVFRGDTVSDTIATILQREPDWAALPAATPRVNRPVAPPVPREGFEAPAARYRRGAHRNRRDDQQTGAAGGAGDTRARPALALASVDVRGRGRCSRGRVGVRLLAAQRPRERLDQSARERDVHTLHRISRHRDAGRHLAGWEVRRVLV